MSQITIYRDAGDRPGDEISDALLTNDDAIRARGTYELDNAESGTLITGEGFFTGRIPTPGDLYDVVDKKGRHRKGVLDDVEVVLTRSDLQAFTADVSLTIEAEE